MFDRVRQDLVYAVRRLRLSPGFTLGAVAVLALGVGVNLAEFHLFNAVLFPKIFVRDVDSLRRFSPRSQNGSPERLPYPAVAFYREHNTVLSAVLTETYSGPVTSDDDPGYLQTTFVSGNYFTELGSVPAYGRLLDEDDTKAGAAPVVVLGFSYWQRRFGSDPRAVGRTIRLNGKPVQVVGIAAHDFTGLILNPRAMWIPVTLQPYLIQGGKLFEDFSGGGTLFYGRVKPGVSNAAVEQQLTALMAELQKQHPKDPKPGSRMQSDWLTMSPMSAGDAVEAAPVVLLILLILVSACANLGNMLLAKGLAREREIEIRIAVGASRWRVIRQLMTENLLLALIAAVAGLLVGQLAARAMLRMMDAPDGLRITTDWRILIAGAVLTLFSTLVFGLTPAIQTGASDARRCSGRRELRPADRRHVSDQTGSARPHPGTPVRLQADDGGRSAFLLACGSGAGHASEAR